MSWCFCFNIVPTVFPRHQIWLKRQCSKLGKMCRSHLSCQWQWKALSQYILFWTSENTFACWRWCYRCSIHSFSSACLPHKTVANGTYSLRGNSFFLLHMVCFLCLKKKNVCVCACTSVCAWITENLELWDAIYLLQNALLILTIFQNKYVRAVKIGMSHCLYIIYQMTSRVFSWGMLQHTISDSEPWSSNK